MIHKDKIKKAQKGDYKSIDDICRQTWEPLYRFVYYKVQNREEAEDITQETYVRALSYRESGLRQIQQYIGFLKTVSLNLIRDRWRKRKRQGPEIIIEDISSQEIVQDDAIDINIQRETVKNALKELNQEQRTVIELRIIKGYSCAETAKITGKSEGAVRALQYRAIKKLASIMEHMDE